MSRAAALGLAATAVAAVPAQAAVKAPSSGRAYERVTPQGTSSPPQGAAISDSGTQVLFRWGAALPEATNGFVSQNSYIAQRGVAAWTMAEAIPGPAGVRRPEPVIVEAGGTRAVIENLGRQVGVDAGVWRREADGSLTELLRIPAPSPTAAPPYDLLTMGASADLSRVVVYTQAQLVPEALPSPNYNIYELTTSGPKLLSIRPDGTPVNAFGGAPDAGNPAQPEAVSRDGRTVIFQDRDNVEHSIYARIDGTTSIDVSASQRATPDPNGAQAREFNGASADGKHIYFTSREALTDDAETTNGTVEDLYEYDVDAGTLQTMTPGFGGGVGRDVLGVTALAPDGSRIYYIARAALPGTAAVDGGLNLYRYDRVAKDVRFIATLSPGYVDSNGSSLASDEPLASVIDHYGRTAVTEDGRLLAFLSYGSLTGPESQSPDGTPRLAVYTYDDTSGDLTCISCGPPGSRARGDSAFTVSGTAGNLPVLSGTAVGGRPFYSRTREISADRRRVFFTSPNALAPGDVNGRFDVYEWSGGSAHLISPGTGPHDARFQGSSASGDDVVIATTEQLVGSDTDVLSDLYDVRVGGGFPEPPAPPAPCTGEACKGMPTRPTSPPVAASISFAGPVTVDVPRGTRPKTVAKLSLAGRAIRGSTVTVKVKVNAAGRLSVSGARVVTVRKTVSRSGTYSLRVRLTSKARRSLKRHGRLKVGLRVGYVPKQGRASSKIFSVSLKG